jgi:hypothetical protein
MQGSTWNFMPSRGCSVIIGDDIARQLKDPRHQPPGIPDRGQMLMDTQENLLQEILHIRGVVHPTGNKGAQPVA